MSTQSTLTVTGFVGSSVKFTVGKQSGVPYAWFRLGSTHRTFDKATGAYRDAPTQWYTVKVWRQVATNIVQSLRKGEPVVVSGRLHVDEWTDERGQRASAVIEATALGHDLVFGTAKFDRTLGGGRSRAAESAPGEPGQEVPRQEPGALIDISTLVAAPDDEPDDEPEGEPDGDDFEEDEGEFGEDALGNGEFDEGEPGPFDELAKLVPSGETRSGAALVG
ncbi:MAG: single-stranded DNA-binding protein [Micrococcales bacterium]|nr:single-stranded DNA-binding protein [Micrococcales bacterium]